MAHEVESMVYVGKTQDNTLNSLWFGESSQLNKKALDVAMKMAA